MKASQNKVIDLLLEDVSLAVAITGIAYSDYFPIPGPNDAISFEYQFTSGGTVKAKVELEQGNQAPVDGESGRQADLNFVVPDGAVEFDNECTDELTHIKAYPPCSSSFGRVKITGLGTNDASTVLSKLKMSISK